MTLGIWAMGPFVLTVLVRVALPIELGEVRSPHIEREEPRREGLRRSVRRARAVR